MPFWIAGEGQTADCNGWATVKETNGTLEVLGCHQLKQDAIDQAIAISLSEGDANLYMGEYGKRAADGAPIVICDIDDTLISGGERVERVYEYLHDLDAAIVLVTGRPESTRARTEQELERLEIEYNRLIMNDGSTANSNSFKKAAAVTLLETYNVILAIENNPDARRAYRELGIETLSPSDLPEPAPDMEEDEENDEEIMRSIQLNQSKGEALAKIETRVWNQKLELREGSDGMTFEGYAAVWDSPSEPLPFTEVIQRGAFAKTLRARNDIKLLWNHDKGEILGSTRAGTLTLIEDEVGLFARAVFPATSRGRDTAELVRRGDVDSMSFGFSVPSGGDTWSQDGATRVLKSVRLHEISLVGWPAYSATAGTVSVRSYDAIALRASVDAERLSEAMQAFESGNDLTSEQADLIRSVLDQVAPKVEEDKQDEPSSDLLTIKRKQFEMLLKQIGY